MNKLSSEWLLANLGVVKGLLVYSSGHPQGLLILLVDEGVPLDSRAEPLVCLALPNPYIGSNLC